MKIALSAPMRRSWNDGSKKLFRNYLKHLRHAARMIRKETSAIFSNTDLDLRSFEIFENKRSPQSMRNKIHD
jgi:hypothetical protein